MTFDWNSFQNVALLLQKFGDEGCKRSAVSRIYYCVFNIVRRWLKSIGKLTRHPDNFGQLSTNEHFNTRRSLHSAGHLAEAVMLDSLRDARNKCDYRDTVADLDKMLQLALENATLILKIIPQPYVLAGFP